MLFAQFRAYESSEPFRWRLPRPLELRSELIREAKSLSAPASNPPWAAVVGGDVVGGALAGGDVVGGADDSDDESDDESDDDGVVVVDGGTVVVDGGTVVVVEVLRLRASWVSSCSSGGNVEMTPD